MLRRNTGQAFITVLLAFLLSLCTMSAFSMGVREIKILRKDGVDTDTYRVTAMSDGGEKCVDHTWPTHVDIAPGGDNIETMHIRYLSTANFCDTSSSTQLFEVQSKEHPDRVAAFWWSKSPGEAPRAWTNTETMDPFGLLSFDINDGDKIKVWIDYDAHAQ